MYEGDGFVVWAGAYPSLADAREDFTTIQEMHHEKFIGYYEAALFTKEEGGKVKIVNTDETPRARGAVCGAVCGAVLGLLFPPSLIVWGLGGAGIGALIGHVARGLPRHDLKDLGDMLDEGEAGVILIGETTTEEGVERMMHRARRTMKKEIRADTREMRKALDEVAKAA